MNNLKRIGAVAGVALSATLLATTSAFATWSSSLTRVHVNFNSREWADSSYTQIHFKNCSASDGARDYYSVTVELMRVDGFNKSFGSKTFSECFSRGDGDVTSTGVWNNLPSGDYVFIIRAIGNQTSNYPSLSVADVIVDTTKAD
ncbi:hypothetical protein [Streptomyces griseiscabiei]|uniref:Secreted protein n=1 Tax=Streptomyces griseiscabiei TaxID=2993540 RepID=A0ABU4LHG6_9ACTN|nr:hypothetical protein [Streptomyces griseiscabiei]MBZ3908018.1 hypothetical protein [Streptomyces griseiscabiei]MDX2915169.1 hypothetical protein [Streptomyces griseiscabiei]